MRAPRIKGPPAAILRRWSLGLLAALLLAGGAHCGEGAQGPGAPDASLEGGSSGPDVSPGEGGTQSDGAPDAKPKPSETTIVVHVSISPDPVFIRGDKTPLSWEADAPMTKTGDGEWTYVVPRDLPALEFKPRYRTTWARGPNYAVKKGSRVDVYPHFFTTQGTVTRGPEFQSAHLPRPRRLWTYLPPTYIENEAARFPVLYMHDGANLFSKDTAFGNVEWTVDETLDAGAESGAIREAIVIGVESTADRIDELTPSVDAGRGDGGRADDYLKMVTLEIKPTIDRTLRTLPARESTGVMGSSLGGLVSVYAGAKYAGVFGFVGAMSPSTWWDNRMILGVVARMGPVRPLRFYVDSGDSGASNDGVADTRELARALSGIGYAEGTTLKYVVQPGAIHNETYWAQRLPAALAFLLGPGR